ncbi:YraN family protein [Candidatus Bipolaricaulota bacterium]|nr:YraN family protein [Candidatus Bipolaricaulota bacterium]
MMNRGERIGKEGEKIACEYLQEHGYALIERNWRCPFGEIDIIARDGDTLAFVEVKRRSASGYGGADGALTLHKRRRIIAAARMYLSEVESDLPVRFDLVAIEKGRLTLLKSAFELEDRCTPAL